MGDEAERLPAEPARPADVVGFYPAPGLRRDLWINLHAPYWTTSEQSRADPELDEAGIRLRLDEDRPDRREEDAPLQVLILQAGAFTVALGSEQGTVRHRSGGPVARTWPPGHLLWAPSSGQVEVTVSISVDEGCMPAAWLVGTGHHSPGRSGDICLSETGAGPVGRQHGWAKLTG